MAYELSTENVLSIHDACISEYGGIYGVRDQGTFEALCAVPYLTMFGMDLCPSIFDKAAKFLEGFARHQVFLDGNKRTALATANVLLELNDISLDLSNEEAYNFTMKIANDTSISIEDISKHLEKHATLLSKERKDEIEYEN